MTIDAVASPFHINLKYHNDYVKLVIIRVNLFGAKRIHNVMQLKGEGDQCSLFHQASKKHGD